MILQIDVTVAGPGSVMTGSVAVTVNTVPVPAAVAPPAASDLAIRRAQQRSQAMRWGMR